MNGVRLVLLLVVAAAGYVLVSSIVRSWFNPITRVSDELVVGLPADQVERELASLLGSARRIDLRLVATRTHELSYVHYPGWTVAVALLTFPLGLVVLFLGRERLALTITVNSDGDRTDVRVFGEVHRKLALEVGRALQIWFRASVVPRAR